MDLLSVCYGPFLLGYLTIENTYNIMANLLA